MTHTLKHPTRGHYVNAGRLSVVRKVKDRNEIQKPPRIKLTRAQAAALKFSGSKTY